MKHKTGLPPETHRRIGRQLYDIRRSLLPLVCEIGRSYPKNGVQVHVRLLARAQDYIDQVRSDLDSAFFREHPGVADTDVYYPGNVDAQQIRQKAEGKKPA